MREVLKPTVTVCLTEIVPENAFESEWKIAKFKCSSFQACMMRLKPHKPSPVTPESLAVELVDRV
ncbi:MAG: hypothetical protein MI806_23270, partial [Minwuiales bacterium]|nr:hypothetical protein [Minwuiales bacterium]